MSPKTMPMHASAAGAQACVVGACAAVPIFSAIAIAAVHCSPMKNSRNIDGRKPQAASIASTSAPHKMNFEYRTLGPGLRLRRYSAMQKTRIADVCFGSKSDIGEGAIDVRFTPKSGHGSASRRDPFHTQPGDNLLVFE